MLSDALLVSDEGCETAIGERVLEQPEDSLERAGGYVSTDAHTVDDVLGVTDTSGEHLGVKTIGLEGLYDVGDERYTIRADVVETTHKGRDIGSPCLSS